jgi:cysteine synthase A
MTTETSRTTSGRKCVYDSVVETIGDTPCIRINNLAPDHVRLYAKAEFFNPAASVKDRLAISIIEEAERSGALQPGQGLRGQRLSVGRYDGRQFFNRASQAHAFSRS